MYTLREKIEDAVYDVQDGVNYITGTDTIMQIIENHIEWSSPCRLYGHVYSGCGRYEINNHFTLYERPSNKLSSHNTLEEAKQAAQTHKEGQG